MSPYRDSLPDDETRARYDEAYTRAGRLLAAALADLWHDSPPVTVQAA